MLEFFGILFCVAVVVIVCLIVAFLFHCVSDFEDRISKLENYNTNARFLIYDKNFKKYREELDRLNRLYAAIRTAFNTEDSEEDFDDKEDDNEENEE